MHLKCGCIDGCEEFHGHSMELTNLFYISTFRDVCTLSRFLHVYQVVDEIFRTHIQKLHGNRWVFEVKPLTWPLEATQRQDRETW